MLIREVRRKGTDFWYTLFDVTHAEAARVHARLCAVNYLIDPSMAVDIETKDVESAVIFEHVVTFEQVVTVKSYRGD